MRTEEHPLWSHTGLRACCTALSHQEDKDLGHRETWDHSSSGHTGLKAFLGWPLASTKEIPLTFHSKYGKGCDKTRTAMQRMKFLNLQAIAGHVKNDSKYISNIHLKQ
jgi:hypothetical protein